MGQKQALIEAIAFQGDISTEDAGSVFDLFVKVKAIKFRNAHDGYEITWGGYMDREVIQRARQVCNGGAAQ